MKVGILISQNPKYKHNGKVLHSDEEIGYHVYTWSEELGEFVKQKVRLNKNTVTSVNVTTVDVTRGFHLISKDDMTTVIRTLYTRGNYFIDGVGRFYDAGDCILTHVSDGKYNKLRAEKFKRGMRKPAIIKPKPDPILWRDHAILERKAQEKVKIILDELEAEEKEEWIPQVGDVCIVTGECDIRPGPYVKIGDEVEILNLANDGEIHCYHELHCNGVKDFRETRWYTKKEALTLKEMVKLEEEAPVKISMKLGQKVKIRKGGRFSDPHNIMNPLDVEGTIIEVTRNKKYPIWVDWGDSLTNSYAESDLEAL